MTGWPLETDARLKRTQTRAEGLFKPLRAFFCLCLLLPFCAAPERAAPHAPGAGMDAPPPPVLESLSRLGVFGGLERRPLSGWPAESHTWGVRQVWGLFVPLQPEWPTFKRASLAELQQWQLEGG